MGRGSGEDVMTQLETMTHVQRTPTIPMTKRESLDSNGTRVSLLQQNGKTTKKWESKDFVNTNPNMVAGKKRSPGTTKKVKRTDSYKIALNRESVFSTIDDSAIPNRPSRANGHTSGLSHDRKKYNTLPRTVPSTESLTVETKRTKHENEKSKKKEKKDFDRNASQRSGTYPSPDTDTDQQSVMTDRKKKSTFRRMKERLILTFRRDRDRGSSSETKKGKKNTRTSKRIVKPQNKPAKHGAFATPSDTFETSEISRTDYSEITIYSYGQTRTMEHENGHQIEEGSSSDKKTGFFHSIRQSMRRKPKRNSSKHDPKWQSASSSSQSQSSSSMERGISAPGRPTHNKGQSQQHSTHHHRQSDIAEVEETFIDADDSITGLFESLIDPNFPSGRSLSPRTSRSRRPDTSHLRLDGLRKCTPRSPVRDSPDTHVYGRFSPSSFRKHRSVSEDDHLEVDGVDEADGFPEDDQMFGQEDGLEFADVSQLEQQRRIDGVARCLAAIGDSIANRREAESAGSSMEDANERSELERGLLRDLRKYGDEIDGTLFGPNKNNEIKVNIIPIVCNIIRAQDYSGFKSVITQELKDTVGWETVAWYTYLMKSAVCIASTGKTVGSIVKRHATQYFSSNLKPWINDRPNGWQSIHEETDIESELD